MLIFDTETLASELGLPEGTSIPEADAHFKASPGNNYFRLTKGSKAEDETILGNVRAAADKAHEVIRYRMGELRLSGTARNRA